MRGRVELGSVLVVEGGGGVGLGDPGWSSSLQRPGKSSSVNRGACWRGRKQKGSSCSLRSRGGLCKRGSRALTSDPGSSPRSPGAARPLFTQDPSRRPRSCRARVLLNPPFPDPVPSPPPPRRQPRGRILRQGTPAPPPPREPGPRRPQSGRGRGVQNRPPLPGRACGGGEERRRRGRGPERRGRGGPAPLPCRGLDLLTAIGPSRPAPSPSPLQPRSFRGNVGRK